MKAISITLGAMDLSAASFLQFGEYTLNDIADMGAVGLVLGAQEGDDFFQVSGEFVMGTESESGGSVHVKVTEVKALSLDDDELEVVDSYAVAGAYIEVDASAVMAVTSTVCTTDEGFGFDLLEQAALAAAEGES